MSNPQPTRKDRKRLAVLFSAALFPGAGQLLQKRWLVGLLLLAAFLIGFAAFIYQTLVPMFKNLWIAANGFEEELITMSLPKILASFGICAILYVIGLIDTLRANKKSA